jgi:predicted transcriptional regulator
MARQREELSETEQEVLKTLWDLGAGTVRDVCDALNRRGPQRAYTTILTFLLRLQTKGYITSDKSAQAHVFRSTVSREALLTQRLTKLVDDVCEGTAAPIVHALVRGNKLSRDDIARLRQFLDEAERDAVDDPGHSKKRRKK